MAYTCTPCGGANPVMMIITSLRTGETDQACDDDTPLMLIGQLAIQLEVDPQKLYDVIQKFTVREAAKTAKAAEPATSGVPAAEDICRECGKPFGDVSPDCPRKVWDRHPKQEPEGDA